MVKPEADAEAVEQPAEPISAATAPEVVVATEPTELIVTDGPAVFVPLVDDLLVLRNSDDDVFMHVASQQFYIVLAGRWYHSESLNGPWHYQAANDLPTAFADIPPDSAQADSRVFVAGTPEAEEAVQDAQIPDVQAVKRGPADVDVEYDGEPEFTPVEGTDLNYAANSGDTVLQSNRRYYLVEDGVWYESSTPNGPWEVATQRPDGVEAIAPSSPVYNAKYVYIYGSTPSVVYVGYTPGYLGNYVYYDTVVYGTGWYYRPWVSPWYYYPRPSTWGFHVSYNSWYGWNFGLSWNWGWGWGPFYAGFYSGGYWHHSHHWHHRYRGHWRPRGHHRPRPVPYARHGYSRDRYGHSGYRGNRGGYVGNQQLHEDSRGRDRGTRTRDAYVRNAAFAGTSKERRHTTDPVRASDLRLKARARDVDAAAARNLLVADRRGDVSPRLVRDKERTAAVAPVGGGHSKVRQHATTPVRSGNPQVNREAERRGRDRLAGQPRSGSVGAPAPRRPVAGSPTRFSQSGQRQAEQSRQRRSTAVSSASRGPAARRGQGQPARAEHAPARQAPPVARRDAPRTSPGPRNVARPPNAGVAMRQQAPAPRAGPRNRANRAAAPAPQPRGGHQGAGRQAGGSHGGPKRNRKH
jgi:hypothetical protein